MDEATAREVVKASIRAMALFDQLAETLALRLTPDEFHVQRHRIGAVMGEISVEVLNPMLREFPGIEALTDESWRQAGELQSPYWLGTLLDRADDPNQAPSLAQKDRRDEGDE